MSEHTTDQVPQFNPTSNPYAQRGPEPYPHQTIPQTFQRQTHADPVMPSQTQVKDARAQAQMPKLDPSKPLVIGGEEPQDVELIQVKLVGVEYQMPQPKSGSLIKLVRQAKAAEGSKDDVKMLDIMLEWIPAAFGREQGAHISARLDDPGDRLDITHISELMETVIGTVGGENPTT